jgi:hypothetical protein
MRVATRSVPGAILVGGAAGQASARQEGRMMPLDPGALVCHQRTWSKSCLIPTPETASTDAA